jgi:hypothetical protein
MAGCEGGQRIGNGFVYLHKPREALNVPSVRDQRTLDMNVSMLRPGYYILPEFAHKSSVYRDLHADPNFNSCVACSHHFCSIQKHSKVLLRL